MAMARGTLETARAQFGEGFVTEDMKHNFAHCKEGENGMETIADGKRWIGDILPTTALMEVAEGVGDAVGALLEKQSGAKTVLRKGHMARTALLTVSGAGHQQNHWDDGHMSVLCVLSDNYEFRVYEGSHLWDKKNPPPDAKCTVLVLPRGSVVVFDGGLVHGAEEFPYIGYPRWSIHMYLDLEGAPAATEDTTYFNRVYSDLPSSRAVLTPVCLPGEGHNVAHYMKALSIQMHFESLPERYQSAYTNNGDWVKLRDQVRGSTGFGRVVIHFDNPHLFWIAGPVCQPTKAKSGLVLWVYGPWPVVAEDDSNEFRQYVYLFRQSSFNKIKVHSQLAERIEEEQVKKLGCGLTDSLLDFCLGCDNKAISLLSSVSNYSKVGEKEKFKGEMKPAVDASPLDESTTRTTRTRQKRKAPVEDTTAAKAKVKKLLPPRPDPTLAAVAKAKAQAAAASAAAERARADVAKAAAQTEEEKKENLRLKRLATKQAKDLQKLQQELLVERNRVSETVNPPTTTIPPPPAPPLRSAPPSPMQTVPHASSRVLTETVVPGAVLPSAQLQQELADLQAQVQIKELRERLQGGPAPRLALPALAANTELAQPVPQQGHSPWPISVGSMGMVPAGGGGGILNAHQRMHLSRTPGLEHALLQARHRQQQQQELLDIQMLSWFNNNL